MGFIQISLLAGATFWETVGIPSKGVPSIKVRVQTPTDTTCSARTRNRLD